MSSHDHGHHHSHHPHAHGVDAEDLQELLDLDAQVFAAALQEVRADIERAADAPVRSILDLGAGTGTGTLGLLQHFPDAYATAIDGDEQMLERLRLRAGELGLADRVETVLADLDEGLPVDEQVDLAWASASMHHMADPDRTLAEVAGVVRPGGLVAVVELTGYPRFLPDGTAAGAAEAGAHAVLAADRAVDLPAMESDWSARLVRAGLVVLTERAVVLDLTSQELGPEVDRYAFGTLTRIRGAVADQLSAADLEQLDALLDGGVGDVRGRTDLHVRAERQLRIARKPASVR